MPDKRTRGSTHYSKHPATRKVRARIAAMAPAKREAFLARSHEYQAIRACCLRESQRPSYLNASIAERRTMLVANARTLLEKRRDAGKIDGKVNLNDIVTRHLQKESQERTRAHMGVPVPPPGQGLAMEKRETVTLFDAPATPAGEAFMKFDEEKEGEGDPELGAIAVAYPDYAVMRDIVDALRREVACLKDEVGALRGEVNILRRGDPIEDDFL
ncbi:uncharacterized protein J7T54_000194 [Emericellopsis cladophorae]|uniref:Uncharacterized protein n=1 Tax=Emericellopsis cladophorae TaxID=2686198 RepID=A0A9P9Y071_9HYPO|nr:uncharacterized protein J7T54_000194 [Emericellopsis cladophorae]KAI6780554.1 hypothetical protein J7T54_000194 [Emericellopsis cladophorae]